MLNVYAKTLSMRGKYAFGHITMIKYTVFLVFSALFCAKVPGSDCSIDNADAATIQELQTLLEKQSDKLRWQSDKLKWQTGMLERQSEQLTNLERKFEILSNECVKKTDLRQNEAEYGIRRKDKSK